MAKFSYRKPEQAPLIEDSQRMTWSRPAPAPQPVQKVGPAPPRAKPRKSPLGDWHTAATEPWPEHAWRMRELMRRVRAGEDFESVKRELWADEYRGE